MVLLGGYGLQFREVFWKHAAFTSCRPFGTFLDKINEQFAEKKRNFGPLSRRLKMSFAFLWQLGPKVSIVGEMGAKYSFTIFSLPFLHIYCSSDQKKTFLAGSSVSVRWLLIRLFPIILIEEINRFYVCWQLSHKINYLALKNDARFLLFCNWRFH